MEKKEIDSSFGIDQIDNISPGGIPPGAIGLLRGPSGCGKSSVLAHFLFEGARRNENVCLISTEPPSIITSRIKSFNEQGQSWIKDGYITILNIQDLMDIIGVRLCEMEKGDGDLIYDLLIQIIDHLDAKRLVIDPINPLVEALEETGSLNFFQGLKDELLQRSATCFLCYDTVSERKDWENKVLPLYDLDIVIVFRKERDEPLIFNTLSIERWRSSPHSKTSYVVDISRDGVILVPRIKPLEVSR
jgi:KaiC/GvpD/RAD55 family RecA-like ATPase